ncbi:MAG: cellulase family glycosylhydrolase [Spirochaetes bacterium]|nr:cellulase family glycosylhydrolase [Spirochaetota bacterium]
MSNDILGNSFLLGVNYWPRHRGPRMWSEFNADEIDGEFAEIKAMGMNTVRIFPVWDDFQPLKEVGVGDKWREIVMRNDEMTSSIENPAMIDEKMMKHFDTVLALADKHGLKLIVALMTGWMSGMLFDVSWRKNRNIYTDPFMMKWQLLYCGTFAKRYSDSKTIIGWEYGNEHNCFMHCPTGESAWTWLRSIANEIRVNDRNHPVVSGMHSLTPYATDGTPWGIDATADSADVFTVHPYPPFTPGTFMDSLNSMRPNLHATAESRFYASLGKKPCLCEETGTLGDTNLSELSSADFIRRRLFSLFANGDLGCIWWCGVDFSCGEKLPYRWVQMENDGLGLIDVNKRVKPAGQEFKKFSAVTAKLPKLPDTKKRAAIVIRDREIGGGEKWTLFYNAYVLCKQAGIEADFVYPHDSLDNYDLIICPSIAGHSNYFATSWNRIMKRVANGATLFLSYDGGHFTRSAEVFGLTRTDREPMKPGMTAKAESSVPKSLKDLTLTVKQEWNLNLRDTSGTVLMRWNDGTPAMTEHAFGKGKAIFLGVGIEAQRGRTNYALENDSVWRVYDFLRTTAGITEKIELADAPFIERTYHAVSDKEGYFTVINHTDKDISVSITAEKSPTALTVINDGYGAKAEKSGPSWKISLPAFGCGIFKAAW